MTLVASACSSSGAGGGSSSPPASSANSGASSASTAASGGGSTGTAGTAGSPTGSPVTVAVLCSCSGPFGQFLVAGRDVADAWSKSVNASGGINGHPVQLINYDDGGDAGKAVTEAQSAISAHADVILDLSPLDAAWEKTVDAAKIPVVGGELTAQPYATDANFYPSGQTPDSTTYALVATAKAAGAKNVGALYCVEAPSCSELVAPMKSIGGDLGVPSVYQASVSATAPNYTAQCLAAKDAGVAALAIADVSSVIMNIGTDCDRQGYDPVYVTAGTGFAMTMASVPGIKDQLWSAYPTMPFFADTPAIKKMRTTVEKYYPGLQDKDTVWSQFAAQAWTGGLLIEAAVKAGGSGDVSAASVTTGLNSLRNETLDGLAPPLTFTAGKPHVVDCWFTARLENGTPKVTDGGKTTCKK